MNETIAKLIKEKSVLEQREIDLAMIRFDNTENKEKLGANAMLAVIFGGCKLRCKLS